MRFKKTLCIFLIFVSLMFMVSCQQTPTVTTIVQQDEEKYSIEDTDGSNKQILSNISSSWADHISAYDNKVIIDINAEIDIPQTEQWPIYKICRRSFTQDEVDKYVYTIFGDAEFERMGKALTKSDYMSIILQAKQTLEEIKANPDDFYITVEEAEEEIRMLTEEMEKAPESSDYNAASSEFWKDGDGSTILQISTETGKDAKAFFQVNNDDKRISSTYLRYADTGIQLNGENYCYGYDQVFESDTYTTELNKDISVAVVEADKFLEDLGIEDYKYTGISKKYGYSNDGINYIYCAYGLIYTRTYNGVNRSLISNEDYIVGGTRTGANGESYNLSIKNESIIIAVDDTGVAGMNWFTPMEVVETENNNVLLSDFSDVQDSIINALKSHFSYNANSESKNITITDVKLCYAVINIKNNYDEYRVIPAWVCYDGTTPVVGINAVDCSLIEVNAQL